MLFYVLLTTCDEYEHLFFSVTNKATTTRTVTQLKPLYIRNNHVTLTVLISCCARLRELTNKVVMVTRVPHGDWTHEKAPVTQVLPGERLGALQTLPPENILSAIWINDSTETQEHKKRGRPRHTSNITINKCTRDEGALVLSDTTAQSLTKSHDWRWRTHIFKHDLSAYSNKAIRHHATICAARDIESTHLSLKSQCHLTL